jgi:hypothetical protein
LLMSHKHASPLLPCGVAGRVMLPMDMPFRASYRIQQAHSKRNLMAIGHIMFHP